MCNQVYLFFCLPLLFHCVHYFMSNSFSRIQFFPSFLKFKSFICIVYGSVNIFEEALLLNQHHIAYFLVHSFASSVYLCRSVLNILAISGTSGSSGFGSHSREQMESSTFEMVSAGDHCDLRISRQMLPLELMFGW